MRRFQDQSIKSKLMLLTLLTSSIVLILAGVASITYHLIKVRQNLTYNLSTLADVIGTNSTAALTFNDPKAGEETLAALAAYPHVIAAAIYTKEGQVFSTYVGNDAKDGFQPPPLQKNLSRFERNALILFRPIFLKDESIGTVYIQSDLEDLYSAIRQYTIVTVTLIVAASFVALLLASRFQRVVSEPISHLVKTAKAISDRKDYTIRAEQHGQDELGLLVQGFNEMLDVIQSREAELKRKTIEAQEASRIKSEFVSNVSHELRTPLNAIMGYNSLLLEEVYGAVSESQKGPLEGVQRNANDLLKLVNEVLDLARIESGKMPVEIQEVDIVLLIKETLSGMQPLFDQKSLYVRFNQVEPLPAIYSDSDKIKQILVNLLSNAVKFTKKGGIRIAMTARPDKGGVEISIQDTGIGVKPEELSKIFNTFHQVDASATREFGGVGLGLAIVKDLIYLLQGEVRVESQYGKGSTFTVYLPYRFELKKGSNL